MSKGFLKRWSRRKTAEGDGAERPPDPAAPPDGAEAAGSSDTAAPGSAAEGKSPPQTRARAVNTPGAPAAEQTEEPVDPATLPPLESLGPDSDYTMFLKKGVPEALRTAALRRAWMSDPFIRDFRGPAEYALDYTTAEFDLLPTDDVAKMLDQIFPPAPSVATAAEPPRPEALAAPPVGATPTPAIAAPKPPLPDEPPAEARVARHPSQPDVEGPLPRRKHGGALPG